MFSIQIFSWLLYFVFTSPGVVRSTDIYRFTQLVYNATIPENVVGKVYVTSSEKMGLFISDPLLTVNYKIIDGNEKNFFKAEEVRVGNFWFLRIRTRTGSDVLNRENIDHYILKVKAIIRIKSKSRYFKRKTKTEVHVKILDKNDLNPLFPPDGDVYHVTVPEDTALYQTIAKVSVYDSDIGVNGEVYFSFKNPTFQFAIHPTMGTVSLTRSLNYEKQKEYELTIISQDRGPKPRTGRIIGVSSAALKVSVTPANYHAPKIFARHFSTVMENSIPNIYAIVRVSDTDSGNHGKIKGLEISDGDPYGYFHVTSGNAPNDFYIKSSRLFDRARDPTFFNLTLKATDRGTPPKSSTEIISVQVTNTNYYPPVFEKNSYHVEVEEVAPVNTPVLTVKTNSVVRPTRIIYNIDSGNEQEVFNINPLTGLIATVKPLDREKKSMYSIIISANEQSFEINRKKGIATVNIKVLDNNDNNPVFNSSSVVTVHFDENRPIGSVVYTVNALDLDERDNGYVSYSLANINPVPFSIDHFSGQIKTSDVLDYETMRREYLLKVRASDWGSPFARQSEISVRVRLRDVNDHRPQFEKVDCEGYVSRQAAVGTEVLTLSALDFDAGSIVSYRMVHPDDNSCFQLNTVTGVLTLTCDLTQQKFLEKYVNVSATDGQHFADIMSIHIKIISESRSHPIGGIQGLRLANKDALVECRDMDVIDRMKKQMELGKRNNKQQDENDVTEPTPVRYVENLHAPQFSKGLPTEIEVDEGVPLGTNVVTLTAEDGDHGYNGKLVYVISNGNEDSCFKIDMHSGNLEVIGDIDRERRSKYVLNVTVFDLGQPPKTTSRTLVIYVQDVNDNVPVFEKASYDFYIMENSRNGTSIVRLRASDKDKGLNAKLHFSLVTDTQDFHIDPDSGLLTVNGTLDRENVEHYRLKVRVFDSGINQPLSSTAVVNIWVLDVNDNYPKFSRRQYMAKIREDQPVGSVIMILSAHDSDLDAGGKVHYELEGNVTSIFQIDPEMGVVRLAGMLDFESRPIFNLTVIARDKGDPPLSSSVSLLIEVEDVNENEHAPMFPRFAEEGKVRENQPEGTFVMQLSAQDEDPEGLNSKVTYFIKGDDGMGMFSIDDNGIIRTRAPLDYESTSNYWLSVYAKDWGTVPLYGRVDVYIEVLNENDNTPLTNEPAYYPTVVENAKPGTFVVKLDSFDRDSPTAEDVRYQLISGDPQGFFSINEKTGIINTTTRRLDRESQSEHVLEVKVSDSGVPSLSSTTRVVVTVEDINDHEPRFTESLYRCPVLASSKMIGKLLCRVIAIDHDEGPNGVLEYSILKSSTEDYFYINPKTGVITSDKILKTSAEYELIVQASDHGEPKHTVTVRVLIEAFEGPKKSRYSPVIKKSESYNVVTASDPVQQMVMLIEAEDKDGDRLWFSIVGGNKDEKFMMKNDGGAVLLAEPVDGEVCSQYDLNISVTDGIYTVYTVRKVDVKDINDHRPVFTKFKYTVTVNESVTQGMEILHVSAKDHDKEEQLFYSIYNSASPPSLEYFHMDPNKGILSVVKALDHEVCPQHILTIMVKDRGTPAKRNFARVQVDVLDHNDYAPEFLSTQFEGQVHETAAVGTSVVQVFAVDRDEGKNAQINFAIVKGNEGNSFSMDSKIGIISVAKELSRKVMREYYLTIKATDGGTVPKVSTATVHIILTVPDNSAPKFERPEYVTEMFENEKPGAVVTTVVAFSQSTVYYEIVSGNKEAKFTINPHSGELCTVTELDYEETKLYNLTINATNLINMNASTVVTIHVLDRNDNAPKFLRSTYYGEISESAQIGTLILTNKSVPLVVSAVDEDSGLNSYLVYEIVEKLAQSYFQIDSSTGSLHIIKALDHEKIPSFHFSVQVSDKGRPQLSAERTAEVFIQILDVNDCSPQFEKEMYEFTLLLPTYKGVAVTSVKAFDLDSDAQTVIKYAIVSGNRGAKFFINEITGQISVRDPVDLEDKYKMIVAAKDGVFENSTKVEISVEKAKISGLRFSENVYRASIVENTTDILRVTIVTVIGSGLNEHVTFSILNPSGMFKIGKTSGVIETMGRPFDRETDNHYTLVVEARSVATGIPRVAHVLVEITILDINDNAPIFVNLPYYSVVPIEAQPGDLIRKVQAIDLDMGLNGYIHYELVKGEKDLFSIDSRSGEVRLQHHLKPQIAAYNVVVAAYDNGNVSLHSEVAVPIKVINKNMPTFDKQFYKVSVPENVRPRSPILSVAAESPQGRQLIYSIVKGNIDEEFGVDFNTGVIFVVEELDFESRQQHHITLRATDSVSGDYADVLVDIHVEDVNDNAPMFSQPVYNGSVSEATPFGTSIMKVHATDRDTGPNQDVQYSILGNATAYFHIDPADGIVFIKHSLDHETQPMHHFVVMATDGGSPSLSSTANVWVIVSDMNDNPPSFGYSSYRCVLSEHAERGQFVTMVMASDLDITDQPKLTYSIVDGNENQAFVINSTTGVVSLFNAHQLLKQSTYNLNISVTDGVYSSYTRALIDIVSANKHTPVFSRTKYEVALQENLPPGTKAATVSATDKDRGSYGIVRYYIHSEECMKLFSINHSSGEIYTKTSLDREKKQLYEIPIVAIDDGGRSGYSTVRLTITDINDNAPQFLVAEYQVSIHSNMTVGTTILKVHALDLDLGEAASLEYSIYEKNNSEIQKMFHITHDQGEIYLKSSAKGQENSVYQFFIQAKDRGFPRQQTEVPVSIHIKSPSQEAPQFEEFNYEFFLNEKSEIGKIIATLSIVYPEEVTYSFAPTNEESDAHLYLSGFSIDNQGHIMQVASLDREDRETYNLTIRVESKSQPQLASYTDVSIILMDENDNNPVFESSPYHVTAAENVEEGYTVTRVVAYDLDISNSAEIVFSFGTNAEDITKFFDLDPNEGWITTKAPLDYESVPWYNFSVIVHDNGSPQLSSQTMVYVDVKDYNDNPPVFKRSYYESSIFEDALAGTIIIVLEVDDPDSDASDDLQFYITSGNPQDCFQVSTVGEIYVNKPLDREQIPNYKLTVTVTDGRFVSTTAVAVEVLDANDNPPVCHTSKYTELVSESIEPQTYILTVKATDKDEDRNSKLYYFLTGEGSEDFFINPTSGILKTDKPLDREHQPRYFLIAHVQDKNKQEWECTSTVEIFLSDVNDNPPDFAAEVYTVTIPEDSKVGTLVTKVHAMDKDLGINRKITYSFVDSANGNFTIDNQTGIVRLHKPLDREQVAFYNLTVQASDYGTPQLSSVATILVRVQDINDNPPEFAQKFYHANVSEKDDVGTEIIRVLATSKDTGVNAEITYSIVSGNDFSVFIIHPKSGVISVAKLLDYEEVKEYFLTIEAKDGGTPPLNNHATINISVIDANDNPPAFNQPSYRTVIREDASPGDKIIQVKASDIDSFPNSRLSYSIIGGDKHGQFIIDKDNGYIIVASQLDREMISTYVLEVECKDSGTPSLSSVVLVNIEVSDVNDNPPVFSQANYTAIVQLDKLDTLEGKQRGFTILKFSVTDADTLPNTTPFTFDIISGNEDKSFRLVQQDASLRTATMFNHKYKNEYILCIRVSDGGIPPLSSDTWVTIHIIEESQFPPLVSSLEVAVSSYMDEFPGGVMGRVHATDSDPYDKLFYDIVTPHKHLFKIDPEDGTLVAYEGLDVGSYRINVSVSDGKFTTYGTALVEVSVVTEEAVKNSVGISLDDITPEDFLLSYRKRFLRAVRNILNVGFQDIEIISMQPSLEESVRSRRSMRQDLDVLFAVRKGLQSFYQPSIILEKLKEEKASFESIIGLLVVKVTEDRCTKNYCDHGECVDRIILDKVHAISITTDSLSYVSPQHYRNLECLCEPGYGGNHCDLEVNECARRPCPQYRICVPFGSLLGYTCKCPDGKTGTFCDIERGAPCQGPSCYEEKHPIYFSGKSYTQYELNIPLNRHLSVALQIRTKLATGNLMYAVGLRDYSILEVKVLFIPNRFDFGSGEGLIRVENVKVNDGLWHEIKLDRRDNSAEIVVDRQFRISGKAPGVHELLNLERNDIFFGAEVQSIALDDVRMGFIGCMDDIRVAGVSLPLHSAVSNSVATLRRFVRVDFFCGALVDPGVCGSQPCHNGGTCKDLGNIFSCQCPRRFSGSRCEYDSNPCASNPCLYGGMCYNDNNDFHCKCTPGLTGKRCSYGRYCNPNPCQNGGICEEGISGPICKCHGFHGNVCQFDIDECQTHPCAVGSTCINFQGSFQCHCQPNMTGPLCTESRYTTSITSTSMNITKEEIIGIVAVLAFIVITVIILVFCCRFYHRKRHRRPQNNTLQEDSANEMILKNAVGKDNFSRMSKVSNLEVTPFIRPTVPPRPASYTPSTQEALNVMNNFDTVRSYGSAADDLESIPRYSHEYLQNISKPVVSVAPTLPPPPPSNSASDSDSIVKEGWEHEKEKAKEIIYENKIQNDLKSQKVLDLPLLPVVVPVLPSRGPSSLGISSEPSSMEDLLDQPEEKKVKDSKEGYHWDCSDWATNQKPLDNITEISLKEVPDSSSVQSADTHSQNSQIELLPSEDRHGLFRVQGTDESVDVDFAISDIIGGSEYNDSQVDDGHLQAILELSDMDFVDGEECASSSPFKYTCHPNQYLPIHEKLWNRPRSRRPTTCDQSEDIIAYGFPPQGGRGFMVDAAGDLPQNSRLDCLSMSAGGYTSTNASCSDLSANVCEIEDSEVNSDVEIDFSNRNISNGRGRQTIGTVI
ncbi:fat-like cadherin-related tumor suppressor homolog isoform X3 [Limulus polyphemus]|uniref:Fat-like cadherin-related tumor suppressor homolog isoform X3 n=1 Tax=Limulus polyphemus TaxID=6850 RepID=A0ABM1SAM1_LIMPO|nr:fat-like cadherin-related tumor suppressor homolog isoform X3 [Limulus polyphemus]